MGWRQVWTGSPWRRYAWLAAVALAGIAAVITFKAVLHSPRDAIPERIWSNGARPMEVLVPGCAIELAPTSDLELLEDRRHSLRLRLTRGGATFDLRHDDERRVRITAADLDIVVTGTEFSVAVAGAPPAARVTVERGEVEVHPRGEQRVLGRLHPGESWPPWASPLRPITLQATAMDEPPPATASASSVNEPSASPELVAPADELLDQANEAQREGRGQDAARLLDALRRRFPDDARAGLAAFELGKLRLDVLGDAASAVHDLEQAIGLAPALRDDAEAYLIAAYARLGDVRRCTEARRSYLARRPVAVHATAVAAIRCSAR